MGMEHGFSGSASLLSISHSPAGNTISPEAGLPLTFGDKSACICIVCYKSIGPQQIGKFKIRSFSTGGLRSSALKHRTGSGAPPSQTKGRHFPQACLRTRRLVSLGVQRLALVSQFFRAGTAGRVSQALQKGPPGTQGIERTVKDGTILYTEAPILESLLSHLPDRQP